MLVTGRRVAQSQQLEDVDLAAAAHEYLAEAYLGMGEKKLAKTHKAIADKLRNKEEDEE